MLADQDRLNITKEDSMRKERRGFLKKLAGAGAVAATAGVATVAAAENKETQSSGGVVVGSSPKKEILYKKTEAWEEYYSAAV